MDNKFLDLNIKDNHIEIKSTHPFYNIPDTIIEIPDFIHIIYDLDEDHIESVTMANANKIINFLYNIIDKSLW